MNIRLVSVSATFVAMATLLSPCSFASSVPGSHEGTGRNSRPMWSWPLPVGDYGYHSLSQPYADYGDGSATRYHTGIDIGTGEAAPTITPVESGSLRTFVLNGDPGCNPMGGCTDHGEGNTVIIEHTGNRFSQYQHMKMIDGDLMKRISRMQKKGRCVYNDGTDTNGQITKEFLCEKNAVKVTTDTALGEVGNTEYGCNGCVDDLKPHLHLEIKKFATQEPKSELSAYGYSNNDPNSYDWIDPLSYLTPTKAIKPNGHQYFVTGDGDGQGYYVGPSYDFLPARVGQQHDQFYVHGLAPHRSDDNCDQGWLKIEKTNEAANDKADFWDTTENDFGKLPDLYVCQGNGGHNYVLPLN